MPAPDQVPVAADPSPEQTGSRDKRRGLLALRAAIVIGLTAGATISVATGWSSPVRAVLALGFLLFAPGLAVAELLELGDIAQRLTIATSVSIALDAVLAVTLLYTKSYSVPLAIAILAVVTLATLCVAVVRTSVADWGGIRPRSALSVRAVRALQGGLDALVSRFRLGE